ncbi:MAG TPA: head GIN domain-containing protein [Verrucomicrobiae bacterium]|nr:head GIN domain-containing protein [Verrucomicrobiae bacterium]
MKSSTTKQLLLLASLPSLLWLFAGCDGLIGFSGITGSGKLVTKQFELTGFSGVDAGSAFQVELSQGERFGVTVTADDNLVEDLEVAVSGHQLHLGLKPNVNVRNATLKAVITMPALAGLHLSGAATTTVAGFNSSRPLDVELSGASTLRGEIRAGDARFDVSGASSVELHGSAANVRCRASGASHADLEQFRCNDATVESSGASSVTLNASGKLELEANGASSVRYLGQPANVEARTSGASSIKKG